jgi:hypothetical protein
MDIEKAFSKIPHPFMIFRKMSGMVIHVCNPSSWGQTEAGL